MGLHTETLGSAPHRRERNLFDMCLQNCLKLSAQTHKKSYTKWKLNLNIFVSYESMQYFRTPR